MAVMDPEWNSGGVVAEFSEAERRFEWWRRTVGLFLGPVAFAVVLAWPLPGLSGDAHRLAAIVSLVVAWWVTEAIPMPPPR